ncbi:MAG: enoyl-CoA hydratase/isomerase family protein [Thermoplasmatota archaeon]
MSVDVAIEGRVATITINRPEALNALNSATLDAIGAAALDLRDKVDGILLTGAGKAFVAGADIAEMKDYGQEEAEAFSRRGQEAFQNLSEFPGPVVVAINGFALGGGLELALSGDILVASNRAKLGLPETTLAVVPGFGGTQRLPRRVGPGNAKKLLFTGGMIGAEEALRMGLVDEVVEPDELLETCQGILQKALANGPLAVRQVKRLVDVGSDMELLDAIDMEADAFGDIFTTEDQKEGMEAFLSKRKPDFTGN